MALPKGVKSPVDYTKLYMSQVLEGETISEKALSKKQQRFFGIVRAIQKGEQEPTTPETAKAAAVLGFAFVTVSAAFPIDFADTIGFLNFVAPRPNLLFTNPAMPPL